MRELWRKRSCVAEALVDPAVQCRCGDGLRVDAQPAVHLAAPHDRAGGAALADQRVGSLRLDPQEQPALAARTDRHVAVDQEGDAAEHSLLGQAGLAGNDDTDPSSELLVVGHAAVWRRELESSAAAEPGCGMADGASAGSRRPHATQTRQAALSGPTDQPETGDPA